MELLVSIMCLKLLLRSHITLRDKLFTIVSGSFLSSPHIWTLICCAWPEIRAKLFIIESLLICRIILIMAGSLLITWRCGSRSAFYNSSCSLQLLVLLILFHCSLIRTLSHIFPLFKRSRASSIAWCSLITLKACWLILRRSACLLAYHVWVRNLMMAK